MSLATRCPACGTIFRVVQDQLKVSEGWVRCGQCHEVFQGIESLFDLDRDPVIAARRNAARQGAAPPPTRVFAEQRANAPIPSAVPPAPTARMSTRRPPEPTTTAPPPSRSASPSSFGDSRLPPVPSAPASGIGEPSTQLMSFATSPMPLRSSPPPEPPPMYAPTSPLPLAPEPPPVPSARMPLATPSARMPLATPSTRMPLAAPSARMPLSTPSAPVPFDFARRAEAAASRWQTVTQPMSLRSIAPEPARAPTPHAAVDAELPLDMPIDAPAAVPPFASTAAPTIDPAPAFSPSQTMPITGFGDIEIIEPAPALGHPTLPSRLADDEEEKRAGPPTLASMLPENAEWPPQRKSARRPPDAPESAIVDKTKDPRFLREARSDARWRKPWVRATLGFVMVLLVVAAAAQVAWPLRDTLASRWPATQPAWAWLCEQADCRIEPPRAIASLALDGSSLTRTDTEHVLLFSADLHNRADHAVRMPSFDVSFMDLNGEIVSRKVLSPAQLGIRQVALPALGELHVHARLQVGSLPASGFQADLFYP